MAQQSGKAHMWAMTQFMNLSLRAINGLYLNSSESLWIYSHWSSPRPPSSLWRHKKLLPCRPNLSKLFQNSSQTLPTSTQLGFAPTRHARHFCPDPHKLNSVICWVSLSAFLHQSFNAVRLLACCTTSLNCLLWHARRGIGAIPPLPPPTVVLVPAWTVVLVLAWRARWYKFLQCNYSITGIFIVSVAEVKLQ